MVSERDGFAEAVNSQAKYIEDRNANLSLLIFMWKIECKDLFSSVFGWHKWTVHRL